MTDQTEPTKWRHKDTATGDMLPPDHWESLAEWLASSPRNPPTQEGWADENGVHPDSVKRIKRNPNFRKFQEEWARKRNIKPERIQAVLENLYKVATNGTGTEAVNAANRYLAWCERYLPPAKPPAEEDADTRNLTDDQLLEQIKRLASQGLIDV